MQASRDGSQARRYPDKRARRGRGVRRSLAVGLPMLLFATMALVGFFGLFATVGVFAVYSTGLPPTSDLTTFQSISESIVYDRTGEVELARFNSGERREPVTFEQIPPILIDATTAIEDGTFWTNTGVDPIGIAAAALDTLRGDERGASTITQQLVRQRLLDPELVSDP